ncbi:ABC transporter substrate-binding protein [Blastococcus sp. BMG 814]|uniref:ABC transporter substrate-binding protein n=1 Tax=Blastococcus carthaginiensis TaxID=3050034 RepID=A0ABT9IAA9_9ACTN|nr:ABC transporter substrate-binding protein [Blastococcus carthaginiensis]MDP5182503.1 ABC transporter substrate-binding protein [Blastococcus carthaginiensis]
MNRLRKVSTVGAVAAVTVGIVTGCGDSTTDSGGGAAAGVETVRIGVGVDSAYTPFFLAESEGMFDEAGLDVELVQFAVGGEAVDALSTDAVQLAGTSEVTAIGRLNQNEDLRAILVYQESGDYLKVVLREGLSDVSEAQRIGFVPGLSELSALKLLESESIDPSAVEMISVGPPEAVPLMERGDIDAFVMWEPWPANAAEQGHQIAMSTGDYGWSYVHWLLGNESWIQENEETAQTLAGVLAEAAEMTEQDPQTAAEATEAATSVPVPDTLTAIDEIDFAVRSITEENLPDLQSVADYYVETGKADTALDVESAVLLDWYEGQGE